MKKITLFSLLLISINTINAQEKKVEKDSVSSGINNWTLELSAGQAKGVNPYTSGYYSSDAGSFFGKVQANSFSLSSRFMFSPKFGLKGGLHYDLIKNNKNNGSIPFEMQQIGLSVQGVVNASRLFDIQDVLGRFSLLFHGGIKVDRMTSKTKDQFSFQDHNYNISEFNGGLMLGVTPEFRISNRMAASFDITVQNNYRQHFNWDGAYSDSNNNLNGQLISASFGLSYSFGPNDMHCDWAVIQDKKAKEIEALGKRVDEMETLMNDTDKDGVADYLDQENNSVAGVAVDSRGKMVDLNRNGVPDELERYVENTTKEITEKSNVDTVMRLINEGYVTAYFDFNKSVPTNVSTEGIDFILTYLREHPEKSIDIYGHADEVGSTEKNDALAIKRAEAVKAILVKAGIEPARLTVISKGEDTSVDATSEGAKKLVRRVTFKTRN